MSGPERQAFADRAHRLARRLAEYSQENIAAGWLDDLEFMVWQDLTDRRLVEDLLVSPDGCVLPCLYPEEKEEFRRLSQAIGGWVEYDEDDAEDRAAFVPLRDWTVRFEAWFERARIAVSQVRAAQSARS